MQRSIMQENPGPVSPFAPFGAALLWLIRLIIANRRSRVVTRTSTAASRSRGDPDHSHVFEDLVLPHERNNRQAM
jgi:hypothetical protein